MIKNYFKTTIRSLIKNKLFSSTNILGLAIGVAGCLLIAVFISNELSFDRFHRYSDRVFRLSRQFINSNGSMQLHLGHLAPPFGPLLANDFAEIEESTRLFQNTVSFRKDDRLLFEENAFFAEENVFEIFDIELISGDTGSVLINPGTVLLSERTAQKYFPDQDAVGQNLEAEGSMNVMVEGVFKDFPYNSHFHPDVLIAFNTLRDSSIYGAENLRSNWGNNSFSTYIRLPDGYPYQDLEQQFPAFIDRHLTSVYNLSGDVKASDRTKLFLLPLTKIHLHSHLDSEIEENGDIRRVWIFGFIALLILLIACINYMNLSTAQASTRAKEIGVRKVVGAKRGEVARQFLVESIFVAVIACILGIAISYFLIPVVSNFLGQDLYVSTKMLTMLPLIALGAAIVIGVLAGFYPSIVLSAFRPITILRGDSEGSGSGLLRKVLVVGQFSIATILIIATIVVFRQLHFMLNKDLGFEKEQIAYISYNDELNERYESFENQLLSHPDIIEICRSSRIPSGRLLDSYGSAQVQIGDSLYQNDVNLKMVMVDDQFVPTYGLKLAAGRNFRQDFGEEAISSFLLNESAIRTMGFKSAEEAVGTNIQYAGREGQIAGVINDFNFEPLHEDIIPTIFFVPSMSNNYNVISLKISTRSSGGAINHLENTWKTFLPRIPFEYQFLDDRFAQLYEAEQRQANVFIGFALIAIFIACMGLFGLATFVARRRIKEIGIRKVLGASTSGLVGLLSKDFLKLVFIALLIASPLSWYLMNKWLDNFAYRINIDWWIFLIAGVLAVGVAFLTISYQSIKSALANPVYSLKEE